MKAVNVMARKGDNELELQEKGPRSKGKAKNSASKQVKKPDTRKKSSRKAGESRLPVGAGIDKARQYLREVIYELRKVVWPSRKETVASTAVVLVIVILCGIYLGVVDFVLNRFVRLLIG